MQDFHLEKYAEGVKKNYNGYLFNNSEVIYNPWSILKFVKKPEEGFLPHWVNTSSNEIIRDLITGGLLFCKRNWKLNIKALNRLGRILRTTEESVPELKQFYNKFALWLGIAEVPE